ncbi:MAG: hypothetical protein KDD35_12775, partial [Bdellovibrionales bacterium]|nr:hypothetical protein [Bdellovibrionales bacterium]
VKRIAFPEKTWIDKLRQGDILISQGGRLRMVHKVMYDQWGYLVSVQLDRIRKSTFASKTVGLSRHDIAYQGLTRHNVRVKSLK